MRAGIVIACALLIVAVVPVGAQWYASNALGLAVRPIDASVRTEHEFTLHVEAQPGGESRTLFRDGEEIRRWSVTREGGRRIEEVYDADLLAGLTEYDELGRLVREEEYAQGVLTERKRYVYEQGRMASVTVTDANGETAYTDQYSYWRSGDLRGVERLPAEPSDTREVSYTYRDGRLVEEVIDTGTTIERFVFDGDGRLALREVREDVDESFRLAEREERTYRADGTLWSVRVSRYQVNESVLRQYNTDGRLVEEITRRDGQVVEQVARTYAGERLQTETRTGTDRTEVWDYEYRDDERDPAVVRYVVDGIVQRVDRYQSDGTRTEEVYQRGELVLRVYFQEETRLREEVLHDGEVVSTREFVSTSDAASEDEAP